MSGFEAPARVLVTGAGGNLGRKAIAALLASGWCREVIALDLAPTPDLAGDGVVPVAADLTDGSDGRWRDALARSDAVLHLAARNPMPDATWSEAAASFDMTANLLAAAVAAPVRRFVFASSNHAMGGYKDTDLANRPASLGPDTPPFPGTRWQGGSRWLDSTAYATPKLMGERLCASAAAAGNGRLSCVSVRIGWCQPGANTPETLSAAGMPGEQASRGSSEAERDAQWFRRMWLSNRDFGALVLSALAASPAGWPGPAIVVNGMSANRGMPWDLRPGREWIGYAPLDDVETWAGADGLPAGQG